MKQEKNGGEDLPGYPHYPAKEDITKPGNNSGKVNLDGQNIELPDVNDIPGQEHITPMPLGELADTTISSADEEDIVNGDSLNPPGEDDLEIVMGTEADVTADDLLLLGQIGPDPVQGLDETDEDGDLLNEGSGKGTIGGDLDVPGSEDDDANEDIGEEDEENNYYSRSENNDENTEGIP